MTQSANLNSKEESPEQLIAHYERLIEISRLLNSTFDHVKLLRHITAVATEITDTQEASIMLLEPSTGKLHFEITTNQDPHMMEDIEIPLEGSTAGWIVRHGEPRIIEDVEHEPTHFQGVDDAIQFTTHNLLGAPMKTHKDVIGVLMVVNKRQKRRFTGTDINVLTTLASLAGTAIENARLFRQSDFVAEMVHELRTPLLALKTSTVLLLRPELNDEAKRREMIITMQGETDRLMNLTTEFLDVAQMESGRTKINIKPFVISKLLEESAAVVDPQATAKGINIETSDAEIMVNGDRGKLKQVLLNLLTNAIKYNLENGKVMVKTELIKHENQKMLRIAVEDTGHGISKEDQKKMFQKFFRVKATADTVSGTGLGLVITKHIVEAHGGHIWLESEEGEGTTFFFTVPIIEE